MTYKRKKDSPRLIRFSAPLISLCLVLTLSQPLFSREIKQVTFVSDPWPPFVLGEEGGGPAQGGISIELCRQIFSSLGVTFSSQIHPWNRTMIYLKTGEADLTFPLIQTEERNAFITFTDVVMTDNSRLWFSAQREGNPIEWEEIADLKPYRIGIVSGYSHGRFDQAIKDGTLKTEPCLSYEEGIRKLLHGRMDILLGNESVIFSLIRSHPQWEGKLKFASKIPNRHNYRIGISKKSPAVVLIPEINRLIREMKADGTIDRLIRK